MTAERTDSLGMLRWGLSRYWPVFLTLLVLGGAVAGLLASRITEPASADALVIADRLDTDLAALPRYGQAVFENGQVVQEIAANFEVDLLKDVIPDRVSLITERDSIVFHVVGHDPDPQTAADIANVAADAFIRALNAPGVGVGAFSLQSPAEAPQRADGGPGDLLAVAVGLAVGLLLGVAAVAGLLVARRPVIDGSGAEDAAGVPSLGGVTVPRTHRGAFARPEEFAGLVPVCRRVLGLPTPTVVLVSRPREASVRMQLSVALASVVMLVRDVRFTGPTHLREMVERHRADLSEEHLDQPRTGDRLSLAIVDSSEPLDLVQPPESTTTVLVVPEGIGSSALRAAVVEHLGGTAEARVLLVRRGRRSRRELTPRRRTATNTPSDHDVALAERR
jgi:capsular polysaccharide biosynthesis protein